MFEIFSSYESVEAIKLSIRNFANVLQPSSTVLEFERKNALMSLFRQPDFLIKFEA